MREPETMRLTLSASETGHLVMATVHSSTCAEALQRVVGAFPAEIQASVAAQLADCILAVVTQRLRFRPDLNIRVPECEIMVATHAVRSFIRNRDFFKIISAIETGADHGMWSFQRYRTWLEQRKNWVLPGQEGEPPDAETAEAGVAGGALPAPGTPKSAAAGPATLDPEPPHPGSQSTHHPMRPKRIEIEPVETEFGKILKRPGEQ
jgi:twitching motility protein PilT